MSQVCRYCESAQQSGQDKLITNGLCQSCAADVLSTRENTQRFIDSFGAPILFMQGDPRLVVTANRKASEMFGKDVASVQGLRGGQVFDCIHSFSEQGCGLDPNCEDCTIKQAVVETFTKKKSSAGAYALLDIVRQDQTIPYDMQVTTEPIGDFALIKIDKYIPKA